MNTPEQVLEPRPTMKITELCAIPSGMHLIARCPSCNSIRSFIADRLVIEEGEEFINEHLDDGYTVEAVPVEGRYQMGSGDDCLRCLIFSNASKRSVFEKVSELRRTSIEEVKRLRETLRTARKAITDGGDGAIVDTVWVGPGETLCDLIDNALREEWEATNV